MSKKKERTRLQGEAWHTLKDKLTPCNYYTEENGHVKGIFKDDAGNQYIHWLNDQELEDYNMAIGGRKWGATKSLAEEFEKRQNIKAKTHTTISTTINPREDHAADALSEFARFKLREQNAALACEKFTQFGNALSDAEREEFERWKRREQNAVYGLDTGEGEDQSAWTTVKIDLPKRYLNISEDLDSVLESSDLMKELNELCIRDTQELYVRELLNRIDRCCRWLEANKCYEIDVNIPIAILKNNVSYIKERYDLICDIRSWDNYYVKDGEDVLAEILGVKDE